MCIGRFFFTHFLTTNEEDIHLTLTRWGYHSGLDTVVKPYIEQGMTIGRVALEHTHMYRVYTEEGEWLAEVSGKLRHQAVGRESYPAVGDWVAMTQLPGEERGLIHAVLPRKSKFSRKMAGLQTDEQIIAANIDVVFLVNALNHDFNVRRIERYLILAWECGAKPVIVLSKSDLCDDIAGRVAETEAVAFGVPVHCISSVQGEGLDQLLPYLHEGSTTALLGSSGSGKSTMVNWIMGQEVQRTQGVREGDDRGRHTTTHRELFTTSFGGVLIDTPGMRELQLWHGDDGLSEAFGDVDALAEQCFYKDCQHKKEPGCAVRKALAKGTLDASRYENYRKLQRELAHLAVKEQKRQRLVEKVGVKKTSKPREKLNWERDSDV